MTAASFFDSRQSLICIEFSWLVMSSSACIVATQGLQNSCSARSNANAGAAWIIRSNFSTRYSGSRNENPPPNRSMPPQPTWYFGGWALTR